MKRTLSILLSLIVLLGLFATGAAEEAKNIFMVLPSPNGPQWAQVHAGAQQAGDELGANMLAGLLGTADGTEDQVGSLEGGVGLADAFVVIAPEDSEEMAAAIREIYEAGTPIVLVDSFPAGDAFSAAFLTDNIAAGQMAAEQMIALFKETGVPEAEENLVAIQMASKDSQAAADRVSGFIEYWNDNAPESWKVLEDDMKINEGDNTKAIGFTQELLGAHENLKGVFAPDESSTIGFATGLTETGRNDIIMVGFDLGAEMEAIIRSNNFVVASVMQRQYVMGYEAVSAALALANGEIIEEQDKIVYTDAVVVTTQNIDSATLAEELGQ